ncbi:hypothetical protein [Pseudomonas kurunegalensis]|uniref:hypothetical protein n=1 Tax=Pseudomonas kurunegalensis TaxID=485880 RepID=UPI0032607E53
MNSLTSKGGDVVPGHTLVLDEHSEGQGQLIRAVIRSRITAGAAVFVVGASIDESLLAAMISASTAVGRGADLLIVNPSSPALSHTYNPVLHTAPTKVASHVLNFLADKDATGAYSSAPSAALVRAIVSSLQLAGLREKKSLTLLDPVVTADCAASQIKMTNPRGAAPWT